MSQTTCRDEDYVAGGCNNAMAILK